MAQLVVLANHCAPQDVTDVLRSGARGYIATIATCEDFIKSLELVMSGQTIVPSEGVAPEMLRRTARETANETSVSHVQPETPFNRHRVGEAQELPKFSERCRLLTSSPENPRLRNVRSCSLCNAWM